MTSVSSVSGSGYADYLEKMRQNMFARMDSDSSGTVSKDEFVSARPKEVSETDAASLYDKIDASGTNALTQDQLDAGMEANRPEGGLSSSLSSDTLSSLLDLLSSTDEEDKGPPPSGERKSSSEVFDSMDTDQDGTVSLEEFMAARPKNVSEDQAKEFFASIDTENTGSITKSQFEEAAPPGPPPGPPPSAENSSGTGSIEDILQSIISANGYTQSGETTTTDNNAINLLQQLMQAVQSYSTTAGYGSYANTQTDALSLLT